jgi:hypothetical protein
MSMAKYGSDTLRAACHNVQVPPEVRFTSDRFTVSRFDLAKVGAITYFKSFWWFALTIPLFGIFAFAFGSGILRAIGAMAILWPLTIPGRAFLASSKSSRLFTRGCKVLGDETALYFQGDNNDGMKLVRESFRRIESQGGLDLVHTRRLGVIPIPKAAWSEADYAAFRAELTEWQNDLSRA